MKLAINGFFTPQGVESFIHKDISASRFKHLVRVDVIDNTGSHYQHDGRQIDAARFLVFQGRVIKIGSPHPASTPDSPLILMRSYQFSPST